MKAKLTPSFKKRPQAIASHKRKAEHVRTGGIVDKVKRISTTWTILSVGTCAYACGLNIVYEKNSFLYKNTQF